MPRVVIIGAGISGLSAAYGLLTEARKAGKVPEVVVLEAGPRAGGKIWTEEVEGYVCEWGPDGFLDNSPPTLEMCRELGLEGRLVRAGAGAAKRRFLLSGGRLQELPGSPPAFLRSPLLPLRARLRVLLEPFIRPARDGVEESVAAFARRRLGAEVARTLVDAMVTGIYGGDAEEISVDAAFPRLRRLEAEHGSLLRGAIAQARERRRARKAVSGAGREAGLQTGPSGTLTSFRRGLSELIEALARELGQERLRLGTAVEGVAEQDGKLVVLAGGGRIEAEHVVTAIPAQQAARLLRGLSAEMAEVLSGFPTVPIAVACLGLRREQVRHPLEGFGFLVPGAEGSPMLGCLFSSSVYSERAPEGRVLLRTMLGGRRHPEALEGGEAGVIQAALGVLRPLLGIEGEPEMAHAVLHGRGIPQYTLGHGGRVQALERFASRWPGLHVTGNAFHGVGLNDCIRTGSELGRKLARLVAGQPADG